MRWLFAWDLRRSSVRSRIVSSLSTISFCKMDIVIWALASSSRSWRMFSSLRICAHRARWCFDDAQPSGHFSKTHCICKTIVFKRRREFPFQLLPTPRFHNKSHFSAHGLNSIYKNKNVRRHVPNMFRCIRITLFLLEYKNLETMRACISYVLYV